MHCNIFLLRTPKKLVEEVSIRDLMSEIYHVQAQTSLDFSHVRKGFGDSACCYKLRKNIAILQSFGIELNVGTRQRAGQSKAFEGATAR